MGWPIPLLKRPSCSTDAAAGIAPEVQADALVAGNVLSKADCDIRAIISEADVPVPKSDHDDPGAVIPEARCSGTQN